MAIQRKIFILGAPLMMLAVCSGCREFKITTRVYPDGSVERSVTVSGDSSAIFSGTYPLPEGPGWTIRQGRDSKGKKDDKTYTFTAKKVFRTAADLTAEQTPPSDTLLQVRHAVRADKRFRWFHTFYAYRETYRAATPFKKVPISDFLTREELNLYYQNQDTMDLDKKVDAWLAKSFFEEIIGALVDRLKNLPDPPLDPSAVEAQRDRLFLEFQKKLEGLDEPSKLSALLERFFPIRQVRLLRPFLFDLYKNVEKQWDFLSQLGSDTYRHEVVLPGLLMDTNAATVEGNRASWKFDGERMLWEDYELHAESRTVNVWAFAATGAVIFCILAVLTVPLFRRRSAEG